MKLADVKENIDKYFESVDPQDIKDRFKDMVALFEPVAKCAVTDIKGNNCPEPPTMKLNDSYLCCKCYDNWKDRK